MSRRDKNRRFIGVKPSGDILSKGQALGKWRDPSGTKSSRNLTVVLHPVFRVTILTQTGYREHASLRFDDSISIEDAAPSAQAVTDARHRDHPGSHQGTRHHAGGIRAHSRDPRSRAELHRAGYLFRHVERALLLQKYPCAAEDIPHPFAKGDRGCRRGKCRGDRHGGRPRGGVQDRVAQPSQRSRAISGGGHRRGRDHPRYFHHGRPADREHEFAAIWQPRVTNRAAVVSRRCGRHRPLR